jgi:hypothetical protein
MIRSACSMIAAIGLAIGFNASASAADSDSLKKGNPELKSASQLAFGPEGILFVGDNATSTVYAIGTGDTKGDNKAAVKIEKLAEKIGASLGAASTDIKINDLKVNPASGNLYVAVTRGKDPAIVKIDRAGKITAVELKDIPFASLNVKNSGGSGKSAGVTITGLAFYKGKLYVAGLNSEEFASNLKVVPFPFSASVDKGSSTEIFHGAHGKQETNSPIRTFAIFDIAKETNMMASYTCTPLVKIPVDSLKPGEKVKGTTVAELGNGNTPLDMITYTKDGKDYILMANTARGVMKIPAEGFATAEAISTRPSGETAGVKYETIKELQGVMQLDKLNDTSALLLIKGTSGLDLKTITLP